MKRKYYEKPKFDISKSYDINEVAEVLGMGRSTIYTNNPNSIFSRSLKYKNRRYFERDRVIEYQEKHFPYCCFCLYELMEADIVNLLPSGNNSFSYEFENCTIEVNVSIQDNILAVNKLLIYNRLYDIVDVNDIIMKIYDSISKDYNVSRIANLN